MLLEQRGDLGTGCSHLKDQIAKTIQLHIRYILKDFKKDTCAFNDP